MKFVDEISSEVLEIGSCNTLKIENKKIKAYNTDVYGFMDMIKVFLPNIKNALILGTGGASKSVNWVLKRENINVGFASREKKGKNIFLYEDIESLEKYNIIINTTPLGTFPNVNFSPNIPYSKIKKGTFFIDLVYNPNKTLFMKKGEENGGISKNGLEMLYSQAKKSWDIWDD